MCVLVCRSQEAVCVLVRRGARRPERVRSVVSLYICFCLYRGVHGGSARVGRDSLCAGARNLCACSPRIFVFLPPPACSSIRPGTATPSVASCCRTWSLIWDYDLRAPTAALDNAFGRATVLVFRRLPSGW